MNSDRDFETTPAALAQRRLRCDSAPRHRRRPAGRQEHATGTGLSNPVEDNTQEAPCLRDGRRRGPRRHGVPPRSLPRAHASASVRTDSSERSRSPWTSGSSGRSPAGSSDGDTCRDVERRPGQRRRIPSTQRRARPPRDSSRWGGRATAPRPLRGHGRHSWRRIARGGVPGQASGRVMRPVRRVSRRAGERERSRSGPVDFADPVDGTIDLVRNDGPSVRPTAPEPAETRRQRGRRRVRRRPVAARAEHRVDLFRIVTGCTSVGVSIPTASVGRRRRRRVGFPSSLPTPSPVRRLSRLGLFAAINEDPVPEDVAAKFQAALDGMAAGGGSQPP